MPRSERSPMENYSFVLNISVPRTPDLNVGLLNSATAKHSIVCFDLGFVNTFPFMEVY